MKIFAAFLATLVVSVSGSGRSLEGEKDLVQRHGREEDVKQHHETQESMEHKEEITDRGFQQEEREFEKEPKVNERGGRHENGFREKLIKEEFPRDPEHMEGFSDHHFERKERFPQDEQHDKQNDEHDREDERKKSENEVRREDEIKGSEKEVRREDEIKGSEKEVRSKKEVEKGLVDEKKVGAEKKVRAEKEGRAEEKVQGESKQKVDETSEKREEKTSGDAKKKENDPKKKKDNTKKKEDDSEGLKSGVSTEDFTKKIKAPNFCEELSLKDYAKNWESLKDDADCLSKMKNGATGLDKAIGELPSEIFVVLKAAAFKDQSPEFYKAISENQIAEVTDKSEFCTAFKNQEMREKLNPEAQKKTKEKCGAESDAASLSASLLLLSSTLFFLFTLN